MPITIQRASGWTEESAVRHDIHYSVNGTGRPVPAKDSDPDHETLEWYVRPMMGRDLEMMKGDDELARMKELVVGCTVKVVGLVDEKGKPIAKFTSAIFDETDLWIINDVGAFLGELNKAPVAEGE